MGDALAGETQIWGLHVAREHGTSPKDRSVVGVGWGKLGDLSNIPPRRDAFKDACSAAYPELKPIKIANAAGLLFRFVVEMNIGDIIVYPCKADSTVNIGQVAGHYFYDPIGSEGFSHLRPALWWCSRPRTYFSTSALHEFGAFSTLFSIQRSVDEVLAAIKQ